MASTSAARLESEESGDLWSRASTWGLLLLLLYFALAGVSPFVNDPTAMRAVATESAGGALVERLSKLFIVVACMVFVLQRHHSVRRMSMQTKLITAFPILALLLYPGVAATHPHHQFRGVASGRRAAPLLHHVPL